MGSSARHRTVPDPLREPTLFEWVGGYPALLDMTRIFYSRYVPGDPMLGPLIAEMSPDHRERVAAWLCEVFGGPPFYTERYGGYRRMVSQHIGKQIAPEQRARWVTYMLQSAEDAGLPSDAEFRAAFVAYIEWGSRIAMENSGAGVKPPANMPVPRWWWVFTSDCEGWQRIARGQNRSGIAGRGRSRSLRRSYSPAVSTAGSQLDAVRLRPLEGGGFDQTRGANSA